MTYKKAPKKAGGVVKLLIASIVCLPVCVTAGETITYPGDPLDMVDGIANSLAPSGSNTGKSTSLSGNNVSVNSPGIVSGNVHGAINNIDADELSNNQVFINNGGRVILNIYGSHSSSGNVTNNSVSVNSNAIVDMGVYGGYSFSGNATGNSVSVNSNGTVSGSLYGGYSSSGKATGNTVIINGTVHEHAIGGISDSDDAANNTITFSGGSVGKNVYGGWSSSGKATNNNISMSSGSVGENVYGGYSNSGNATNNKVTINNTQLSGSVIGGWSDNADTTGNIVTLNGSTVTQDVFGGHSFTGNALGNTVQITGGIVRNHIYGGESRDLDASNNTVILSSGQVDGDINGGYSTNGHATDNTVNIDGVVGGYVYGGYGQAGATGNTVTFSGGSIAYGIFGGDSGGSADAFTGNILNVKAAGLSIGGDLKNFQYLNFYVPTTATANTTLLTVGGEADLTNGAGTSSIVNVGIEGGASPLKTGDSITLIEASTLTTNSSLNTTANGEGMQGISLKYEFDIIADTANHKLLATVTSMPGINPQTKALSEGRLAGAAFVTKGADMVSGIGMQNMRSQTATTSLFGVIQGTSLRYDTGSHVDVDGLTLMAGAAARNALNLENLTAGLFIEAGWGNHDTYNSFSNANSVHGSGDTNYYGIGLMGRLDLANNLYAETALRVGRVEADFKSADLVNKRGQSASYDSKSTYTGISLGLGKLILLNEQKNIDLYTRYQWTHVNSDSVNVLGDTFKLDAINSHRLRAGLRYNQQYNTSSSFYAGAAYEYEFDGDAKGSVYGYRLDTPSLKGSTGIFEVGMSLHPQNSDRLSVDLGIQGHVGQREGVSGSVKLNYAF